MRKGNRWLAVLSVVALIMILVVVLVGCGSTTTTTKASVTTTVAPTTTTTKAPASTTTATAATTTTAAAAYDIKAILAAVKADSTLKAMLPAAIQSSGEMKVASDIPYPPWEMFVGNSTSEATGFDYDLSQAVAAKLGIKATFVNTKFDSIILSLQSAKNDVAMSDMYDNKSRQKVLDFVDYANDGTSILVLKGNPLKVGNLDTLSGKAVGCEKGTTQAVMLETLNATFKAAGKPEMTINQYPDQPAALLAVQSGKVIGDLTDHSTASYVAMSQGGGGVFEVVADPSAPSGYESQPVGAGILKTNTQLRDAFQKALQALIDDGTYKKIIDQYGLLPVQSAQVNSGTSPGE